MSTPMLLVPSRCSELGGRYCGFLVEVGLWLKSGATTEKRTMPSVRTSPTTSLPERRGSMARRPRLGAALVWTGSPATTDSGDAIGTSGTSPRVSLRAGSPSTTTELAGAASAAGVTVSASRMSSAIVARPRVDDAVDQVHEEVRGKHHDGDHQERSLHEGVVLGLDRREEQLADPGVAERLLHDHG